MTLFALRAALLNRAYSLRRALYRLRHPGRNVKA